MSHNKTKLVVAALQLIPIIIGMSFSSCSEYLKGRPFKTDYLEIKSDGKLACLDNVSSDMKKFLNSEDSDAEIDLTVNCINNTLAELQAKVEGSKEANSFTADDIYKILSTFARRANISQIAAQNLITMKTALLGGDSNKITKNEIDLLKKYLLLVKDEAKNLKPYIKVFYFRKTEKLYTKSFIKEAFAQLNSSLKNLYRASQLSSSVYSVDNFKDMMINILSLTDDSKAKAEILSKLSKVLSGTQVVLSDSDRIIHIDNITELLRLYSIYSNSYAKFEINTAAGLNEAIGFVEEGLNLLENSLQYKNGQMISSQSLDGLITALTSSNLLTYKISGYTAAIFYRTVLVRVFESGARGNITAFTGIKNFHLRNIRREIAIYKVYSKMLERVAGEDLSAPLSDIQLALGQLDIANETDILNKYDSTLQAQIINNVNDLRSDFLNTAPSIYQNNKIGIATNQNTWEQKWKDLAHGLYIKMLNHLLIQG